VADSPVFVMGAGGWGTALAGVLATRGLATRLWEFDKPYAAEMQATRRNPRFLPGVELDPLIGLVTGFESLAEARHVVLAVPAAHLRATLERARPYFRPGQLVVSVAKGVEQGSLLTLTQVARQALDGAGTGFAVRLAALSGPSHAEEVARRVPTTVVAASDEPAAAREAQSLFSTDRFRVYSSGDLLGVELGGALKNVVALAAGVVDGLGLGDNTKAALMTRGLAEMTRLGVSLGAQRDTFAGLAGMGDLVVTCMSRHSRNRGVGERLGRGERWEDIKKGMLQVAEGVYSVESALGLARRQGVEMPICEQMHQVLFSGADPQAALKALMTRSLKEEGS